MSLLNNIYFQFVPKKETPPKEKSPEKIVEPSTTKTDLVEPIIAQEKPEIKPEKKSKWGIIKRSFSKVRWFIKFRACKAGLEIS